MKLMLEELSRTYSMLAESAAVETSEPARFSEFVGQLGETAQEDLAFWLDKYSDIPPPLELPTHGNREKLRTFRSTLTSTTVDKDLTERVRAACKAHGVTPFVYLFTVFQIWLSRIAGSDDFSIGVPAAQQSRLDQPLIGHCTNLLPVRCRIDHELEFSEFLKSARSNLADAFDHQQTTLGAILSKLNIPSDPSRLSLTSVQFNLGSEIPNLTFSGLETKIVPMPKSYESFEMFLDIEERRDEGWKLKLYSNQALFDESIVQAWLSDYAALLRQASEAGHTSNPKVRDFAMSGSSTLSGPAGSYSSFIKRIFEQAEAGDRAAIKSGDVEMSYGELIGQALRFAAYLSSCGVQPGDRVALLLERDEKLVPCLLGTMFAGAAYVPLAANNPAARLQHILRDAKPMMFITSSEYLAVAGESGAQCPIHDVQDIWSSLHEYQPKPEPTVDAEAPAYIMYTSGSTGIPKGVVVPHKCVDNLLGCLPELLNMAREDRLLAVTQTSFDISVLELFLPLTLGAELHLADDDTTRDGRLLARLIDESNPTIMQATPSTWRMLLKNGWENRSNATLLCGGEAFPVDLANQLLDISDDVWNMYGPTETTVWSSAYRLTPPVEGFVSLGTPLANTQMWVLDEALRPQPPGAPGELFIGGAGVTAGYFDNPDKTAENFLPDPFSPGSGERIYRTGDRVQWLPNGALQFLGRSDEQVKLHGYRIDLGEIETAITSLVAPTACVVDDSEPNDPKIFAFIQANQPVDLSEIRSALSNRLPPYMIPRQFIVIGEFPLNANGKIDRSRLLDSVPSSSEKPKAPDNISQMSEAEQFLFSIWSDVLGHDEIDVSSTFFEVGGNSLSAVEVLERIERQRSVKLNFRNLVFDSLGGLAASIENPDLAPQSVLQRVTKWLRIS